MARLDRVREALVEGNVVTADNQLLEQLAAEVEYALYPPVHEGKEPTYGAILTTKMPADVGPKVSGKELPVEISRQLADGVSAFAVRFGNQVDQINFQDSKCDEEVNLIAMCRRWEGLIVHRSHLGSVRVFTQNGIHIHDSGVWKLRPHSDSVLSDVTNQAPQASYRELESLLRFAFHVLSPSKVGATLVWWLAPPILPPTDGTDLRQTKLNIKVDGHLPMLRALLRLHDGATFISSDGTINSFGHQLRYSDAAAKHIQQAGGTRHTSAKRFSFDEPRVIVVVISEDGPVSVFSDGVKVTELSQTDSSAVASHLRNMVPEKAADVFEDFNSVVCSNCGKHVEVDVITIAGWRERETGECPVCGETVFSRNCWQITTRLVKRLPTE